MSSAPRGDSQAMRRIPWRKIWQIAAILAVAAVAVSNVIHVVRRVPPPPGPGAEGDSLDLVTRNERRFAALRDAFRRRDFHGRIGYVEDGPEAVVPVELVNADYAAVQYAVLPLMIDPYFEHYEWVIANYRAPVPAPVIPPGHQIVEDFGGGVLLLRKAAP